MKKRVSLFLFLAIFSFLESAFALFPERAPIEAKKRWEFWSGALASLDFFTADVAGQTRQTQLNFLFYEANSQGIVGEWPKVGYFLSSQLQVNLSVGLSQLATSSSATLSGVHVLGGVNYSLEPNIQNSSFLEFRAGITTGGEEEMRRLTYLGTLSLGKRWKILENVVLSPELLIKVRGPLVAGSKIVGAYSLIPLQLGLLF